MVNWFKSLKTMSFWQISIAVLVISGSGIGAYDLINNLTEPEPALSSATQTVSVTYRNISQSLTVSGALAYYNPQQLTFGASGTVKEVKVAEGASVKAGDVLATFDDASSRALQKALTQAQQTLATAKDNLEKAKKPYSDADIVQAQAAITSAQLAVNTARDNLDKAKNPYTETDVAQARLAVINAQIALKTAEDNLYKAQYPYSAEDITTHKKRSM